MTLSPTRSRLSPARALLLTGWLLLASGAIMLVIGAVAWGAQKRFQERAVETSGIVVALVRREHVSTQGAGATTSYSAVFEFDLADGRRQRVVSSFSSNPPCCTVGETVRLRFDPTRPERAVIIGFWSVWGWTTVLGGIGGALLLGGVIGVLKGRGLRRMEDAHGWVDVPLVGVRMLGSGVGASWVLVARRDDPVRGPRMFESDPVSYDPADQLRGRTGVAVLFDPHDPDGAFMVDTDFLTAPRSDT